ncbi:hypothetical protein WJX82_001937 [Trebouxia sp. C0006]
MAWSWSRPLGLVSRLFGGVTPSGRLEIVARNHLTVDKKKHCSYTAGARSSCGLLSHVSTEGMTRAAEQICGLHNTGDMAAVWCLTAHHVDKSKLNVVIFLLLIEQTH